MCVKYVCQVVNLCVYSPQAANKLTVCQASRSRFWNCIRMEAAELQKNYIDILGSFKIYKT